MQTPAKRSPPPERRTQPPEQAPPAEYGGRRFMVLAGPSRPRGGISSSPLLLRRQREGGQRKGGNVAGRPQADGDRLPAAEQPQPGAGEDLRPEPAHGAVVEEDASCAARRVKIPHRGLHGATLRSRARQPRS